MTIKEATAILERYRKGESNPGETELVNEWYKQLSETGDWQWEEGEKEKMQQFMEDSLLKKINQGGKVRKLFPWKRVAAAASIVVVLGTGYWLVRDGKPETEITLPQLAKDVAAPKGTKATITLANGQTVLLDSIANGTLATQGNVTVIKNANGEIVYSGTGTEVLYNTLNNPRGSNVVDMTLADGSRVWLNAGSSVTYPVAFIGNERKVEISGEAYFEVVHNASMPFVVQKNDMSVQVLGTHFNVNAYDDEAFPKITLLEGSVKVSKGDKTSLLKPGQQAQLINNEIKIQSADVDEVMAWKNGLFKYNNTDIETVMRQISRWYDVKVSYPKGMPTDRYWGGIQRNLSLANVFKVLEESGAHFIIEGKNVKVLP